MADAEGSSLHGDYVCIYNVTKKGVKLISNEMFEILQGEIQKVSVNISDISNGKLVKRCCPGYKSNDGEICVESRMANPFSESQFSYAMIYLGILLFVVALVSMFIAYRYHYRFRRNQKHGNNYDEQMTSTVECHAIQTSPSLERIENREALIENGQAQ
uniref:Uncharacterized protein n=1 Tax=Panagrolaimus sp. JU765 TaxID=591449 RepID=A0AC34QWB1_9BILA